jgi:hypothetical protein
MKSDYAIVTKSVMALALFGVLSGVAQNARAADVSCPQNTPMVKNLVAYTARCVAPAAEPQQLTGKQVKRLLVTAKSAAEHLTIARYYEAKADGLEARAASYEEAAADYRHHPTAKNLMSPTTAGRYDYLAQGFRQEAKSDRLLAASQEQMAKNAATTAESPRDIATVTQ